MSDRSPWIDLEHRLNAKTAELAKGWDPYTNVWPLRQLIIEAWSMGLDVVKPEPEEKSRSMWTGHSHEHRPAPH